MSIDEMSAEELRLAIARAKGWFVMEWINYNDAFSLINPAQTRGSNIYPSREAAWSSMDECHVPNWSTSIAAAWELIDQIPPEWFVSVDRDGKRWLCMIGSNKSSEEYYSGEGTTAPVAICKAWLAWKESQCS